MESRAPDQQQQQPTDAQPAARPSDRSAADAPEREAPLGDRLPATERILRATVRGLVERGAASLSMQEVADTAGVSKGLIHYHYHDKAALLARVVVWMTEGVVSRQGDVLESADPATAVDAVWRWLAAELERGEIRALGELAHDPTPEVRAAILDSMRRRREASAETAERLFALLALRPRVPAPMLGDVFVAFVDGVALQSAAVPDADRRVVFDVLWLALLSLAE